MKYTHKDLPGSIKHLEIDLPQVEFVKYWEVVHEEALKNVELKGFRKGTAPKEMADAVIDKEKVFNEAATSAVREILKEITQEKGWEIVEQPKIEIEEKGMDLFFKIDITTFPEIKLGDYKKIAKKIFSDPRSAEGSGEARKKEVVAIDEEVQEAINWILNSRAKIVRVNREAKIGDVVNVTYKGKDDQFVLGSSHIHPVRSRPAEGSATATSGRPASNGVKEECHDCADPKHEHKHDESNPSTGSERGWIDKKIVGHKEGEEFDDIKLTAVFERQVPEMTDVLAGELGKFKTVDELKKSIKEGIQKEKEIKEKEKLRIRALQEIVKETKIDIPKVMLERTLAGMLEEYRAYFKKGFKEEEMRDKLLPEAEKSVASNLVLYKIAKKENIEPKAEEVEVESNRFLASIHPEMASQMDSQRVYNYSYDIVKNKKVFEFLEKLV